jgi:hypothetical protein
VEEKKKNIEFSGLWIPKEIWEMQDLNLIEKCFLAVIRSLSNENECEASNKWFSEFFGITKKHVSRTINGLVEKQKISIRKNVHPLRKIVDTPPQKCEYPLRKNVHHILYKNNKDIKDRKFQNFQDVCSHFDLKFFNKEKWADAYDKLIRIDGYTESEILNIVKEFRSDGNWWKDNGNFETLPKLRKKNSDEIKYIDFFNTKLKNKKDNNGQLATIAEHEADIL